MRKWLKKRWYQWLNSKHQPQESIRINRHSIYVLPSKYGNFFLFAIFTLFIGSVNYQLSSGFFLTFFLVSIVMISAWIGHQNLNGVKFTAQTINDVATNETCSIPIKLSFNKPSLFSIRLIIDKHSQSWASLSSDEIIYLQHTFHERGYHQVPRIRIETRYPFGLFVVWSYLNFDQHVYVYPQPKSPGFWPEPTFAAKQASFIDGDEDFYSLKQTDTPWKQPSRISWTTAAKGYGWYEKQYTSPSRTLYFFSTQHVSRFPLEEGLKFICYWLIESEKRGYEYAFHLQPFNTASHGKKHLQQQLRQVAIYGQTKS